MQQVPSIRVRTLRDEAVREGEFVLYWMVAQRRLSWNFALDRALEHARELERPLVILEALRCDYSWASDRLHRFVLEGMEENQRRAKGIFYYPYVERGKGEGKGLLESLAARAAVVVSDDFPCFFLPRMQRAAAERLSARFEVVDSNGLLPLRVADKVYKRAVDFRRFLQKSLSPHLLDWPEGSPLERLSLPVIETLPELERWPAADEELLAAGDDILAQLPIDHEVRPAALEGGSGAAEATLERFLENRLMRYVDERNAVSQRATSELSPYLHFGHLSTHRIFRDLIQLEGWNPGKLGENRRGAREGWWGMSRAAESYLDELITWREVGYNMTWQVDDYHRYESLPEWARKTLEEHLDDERAYLYTLEDFEHARTHDEIWNAAQRELVRDGRIHNYLRMLWGKKILEWTSHPREALEVMIELNNKYALDGRNPNSYSGIFWCLGRYDRAWGPERPIFGKIRFMSSDSTRRKMDLKSYLREYGEGSGQLELLA